MKFNPIYHLLIFGAVFPHIIAIVLTWYALTFTGRSECNPIMSAAFGNGFLIPTIITTLLLTALLYAVPIIFRQVETPGLYSVAIIAFAVSLMSIDAFHDIFILSGNPIGEGTSVFFKLFYQVLHIKMTC